MKLELRDYQEKCINGVRAELRTSRNVLLQAPTGAGKTAMATAMLDSVSKKGNRGFFICHRRELIDQTAKTFDKFGIKYGYIASGYPVNPYPPIQICSIDTLKNRYTAIPAPSVCIWDEAHHLGAAGWTRVHEYYKDSFHIGLSATPQRLDGKGLDDRFDALVPGPSVEWLIDNGFLAKYKLYSVPGANMTGVHTRMGDFVKSETEEVMDRSSIIGDMVNHWRQHARDKLTIGFAVSVKHSEHIVSQFNASGIPAVHLDAKTKKAARKDILRSFAKGEYRVVFNVGLFAEGFDIASNSGMDVTVGAVIDAAPTQSLCNWLQRCGRALRPQDTPAIILDHAGNALRHGMPCQERVWDLVGRPKGKGNASQVSSIQTRQCERCFHVHKPEPVCPECGFVYNIGRQIEEVDGTLEEIDPKMMRIQARMEQGNARTLEDLTKLAVSRGQDPKMARHIMRARQEKQALQERLYNLTVACDAAGIDIRAIRGVILKLKPKELKETIVELTEILHGQTGNGHTESGEVSRG